MLTHLTECHFYLQFMETKFFFTFLAVFFTFFLRFLRFFKFKKTWLFTFFWAALHVFSNTGLMISSLSDRANIWLCQALNSIKIGLAVFEQWRLQWGYPPFRNFRVERDRLIGHIFGSIARRKRRTAKIMAPYYRQLFTAKPMVLTPLSADDLEGVISRSRN